MEELALWVLEVKEMLIIKDVGIAKAAGSVAELGDIRCFYYPN